jgi:prevent-host-death family protein
MTSTVTVRELRNHGGEVLARVQAGETLTVTSSGVPVAELRPLPMTRRRFAPTAEIVARLAGGGPIDLQAFRADLDSVTDPYL